jgi:hypothetical protein
VEEGIQVKLLNFDEVSGETAQILTQYLLQCVKKYKLEINTIISINFSNKE